MKIKTFNIDEKTLLPGKLDSVLTTDEYCVVDIETTGLSRQFNKVVLIGILYNSNNSIVLKQFFAERPSEEIDILIEFASILKEFSYVVTYNGAAFDIPFLKERFNANNLNWCFDNIQNIDILQHLKRERKQLPLENLKLKTVEAYLGIYRKDTISGKDSVLLYNEYVKNPSISLEKTILLHNYEDIYYLNKLLKIFDMIDIHTYDLIGKKLDINYRNNNITLNLFPKDIIIKSGFVELNIKTQSYSHILDIVHYEPNFEFKWNIEIGHFYMRIPLINGTTTLREKCSYVDLNNFNISKDNFYSSHNYDIKHFINNYMIVKHGSSVNIFLIMDLIQNILINTLSKL